LIVCRLRNDVGSGQDHGGAAAMFDGHVPIKSTLVQQGMLDDGDPIIITRS
jgi:hypothetical protein